MNEKQNICVEQLKRFHSRVTRVRTPNSLLGVDRRSKVQLAEMVTILAIETKFLKNVSNRQANQIKMASQTFLED